MSALIHKKRFVMPPTKRVWSLHRMGFEMPAGYGGIKPIDFQEKCDVSVVKHNAGSILARCVKQIESMKDNKVFLLQLSEVFPFDLLNGSQRMMEKSLEVCKWHMQTLGGICKNNGVKLVALFDVIPKNRDVNTTLWFMFVRKLWRIIAQEGLYFTWFRIAIPMSFLYRYMGKFSNQEGVLDLLGILDAQVMVPYLDEPVKDARLQAYVNICVTARMPMYFDVRQMPDAYSWIKGHENQLKHINPVFLLGVKVEKLTKRAIRGMFDKYVKVSRYGDVILTRKT